MTGGKKIAGLPVYVWLGVVAGGLLLGIYLRRRGSTSTDAGAATGYPISVGPDLGSISGGVAGGGLPDPTVSALDPSTIADLSNGIASLTLTEAMLADNLQGYSDTLGSLMFNVPSSAGSGSSATGKTKAKPLGKHAHTHTAASKTKKSKPVAHHHKAAHKKKKVHR